MGVGELHSALHLAAGADGDGGGDGGGGHERGNDERRHCSVMDGRIKEKLKDVKSKMEGEEEK